jgi:hypothetical protein
MRYKAIAAILFGGAMAFLAPRPASAAWSVSISYFHQELSPHGRWVSSAAYGEVWYPTVVAAGWRPYLDGEWAYTDYGWTWVSHDPFGPDPFHYGTWVWIDPYGWCWVPGYVWGPAWVTWAYTDSYIGWACLPPSFDITVAGYAGSPIVVSQNQYVFVPINSFVGTPVSSARVPVQQNATILTSANKVTRFSVSGGIVRASDPPASFVQRVTGKTLHRTSLSSDKLRATTIAAAGVVSGKRVRIVAPAHERKVAAAGPKPSRPKVAQHAAPSRKSVREPSRRSTREATAKSATTSRRPTRAVREKPSGGKQGGTEKPKAVKAPRKAPSAHPKAVTAPRRATREVHGRELTTSRPPARVERRSSAATGPPPKESRRERSSAPAPRAVERRSENPPPPAIKHEERLGSAAPPKASQAHPASPPAAVAKPPQQPPAQPRPQPQGQPAGGKKEKQKEK